MIAVTAALVLFPGRWPGVDESVVEKFAREAGRTASPPLFGIEGDLLLFAFLCAGLLGGFLLGYCFRTLFPKRGESDAS